MNIHYPVIVRRRLPVRRFQTINICTTNYHSRPNVAAAT